MPDFVQIGRPKTFTLGTPAVTCKDLMSLKLDPSANIIKHFGHNRFPHVLVGNDETKLTLQTTDRAIIANVNKGEIVATVTAVWQSVDTSLSGTSLAASGAADSITFTCTTMLVDEVVTIDAKPDGSPAEISLVLIPCIAANGTAPTISITYASHS